MSMSSPSQAVRAAAQPLTGAAHDYDALLAALGDARFALLGEASDGTHEFYAARAHITRRLIEERGFTAVVVEADWPDAYRVNRFVRGFPDDADAEAALSGFRRFPQWMWRNTTVLDFVTWLRQHNDALPQGQPRVGFYGMDLYSLHGSITAVLDYLDKVDPAAAARARQRYGCFEHFGENPEVYGYAASFDLERSCEDKVVQQLVELRKQLTDYARRDGRVDEDAHFFAEQNARLILNAERYYRSMFVGGVASWNLRDQHMVETLEALASYLDQQAGKPETRPETRPETKIVVWAHNSHLGDARATEWDDEGQINVGQLVRERHGDKAFLVGFTTHTGTVTAASAWDSPAQRKHVQPSLPNSYERVFHETGLERFLLLLGNETPARSLLRDRRLERAIGVIYMPESERVSHYFHASLPRQFDAVIHFDVTRAVQPLERWVPTDASEVPETYPSSL